MLEIFENILYVGPEKKYGGIGSVIDVYSKNIKNFKFIPTYPSPSSLNSGFRFKIYRIYFFLKSILLISKALLTDKRIKLLHIHSAHKGSFFRKSIICYIGRIWGKKIVFHIHSGNFPSFYKHSGIFKYFIRKTLIGCNAVVCLSEQWEEYYIKELGLSNIKIIGNPIQLDRIEGFKRNTDGVIRLLFLGKVCDAKGIFDLIEFLKNNRYFKENRIQLTIAGNGEVERLKPLLDRNIEFIGWINDARKEEAFAACDIYVLPSYYEGLPISILEAMASSKPIISTNVGGIPSILQNGFNGWLIEPVSFKELDRVFEEIFTNMDILELYASNSFIESKKYSPDVIINKLSLLYQSILNTE